MITAKIGHRTYHHDGELETYFKQYRNEVIGIEQTFQSPYGEKNIIYADWFASGRLYRPIEKQITEVFGPFMANTHTESTITSSVMTHAYHRAKGIIKAHVNATPQDVLLFDGAGMTSAINKLQRILGLKVPGKLKERVILSKEERPIVFITHMEHHSNHTSWLETLCDCVVIPPDEKGQPDIHQLDSLLLEHSERKLKIGSFSAGSNVTGIKPPYHQLARVMHKHKGICFVDFSASAPYVEIDMHPNDPLEQLDGIFFSPHKFLGGPGSSGVVIFDSNLYLSTIPDHPGGGTVTWTNPWGGHHYVSDIEDREDGGTPGILQGIRVALAIILKEQMGVSHILKREKELLEILFSGLNEIPSLHILEDEAEDRLGVVSFYVEYIHYNLIVKLLNDRFGYQVRGGCSCAGTYGHYLYAIDQNTSQAIAEKIDEGDLSLKPGWVRFSVHPTMTNEEAYGFIQAMKLIVMNIDDWKKDYEYDQKSNDFFYHHPQRTDLEGFFNDVHYY